MFGLVYKTNTIRSIVQVEASGRDTDTVNLIARHKKSNFGLLLNPVGIKVTFDKGLVIVTEREIEQAEISGNKTPTTKELIREPLSTFGALFPNRLAKELTLRKAQGDQYSCPGGLRTDRWSERKRAWAEDASSNSSLGKYSRPK
jgi:hypothetical protein